MNITSQLIYALLFQIGWLVCVSQGNLAALGFALGFAIFHCGYLRFFKQSQQLRRELLWLASITLAGYLMETLFFCAGVLYRHTALGLFTHFTLPPSWLFALWLCFAIALRTCMAFVFVYPKVSYALFALAIPASYLAGTYLNPSVHINKPYALSLGLITLSWMVFLWCLQHVRRRYFQELFDDR